MDGRAYQAQPIFCSANISSREPAEKENGCIGLSRFGHHVKVRIVQYALHDKQRVGLAYLLGSLREQVLGQLSRVGNGPPKRCSLKATYNVLELVSFLKKSFKGVSFKLIASSITPELHLDLLESRWYLGATGTTGDQPQHVSELHRPDFDRDVEFGLTSQNRVAMIQLVSLNSHAVDTYSRTPRSIELQPSSDPSMAK